MDAIVIDGKKLAENLINELVLKVAVLNNKHKIVPGLAIIEVGNNPASRIYINKKIIKCEQVGIKHFIYNLDENINEKMLLKKIEAMNNDPKIHGIIVQLPLPKIINEIEIASTIDPIKDVDGLHPFNLGLMVEKQESLVACTPQACVYLIKTILSDLSGKKALVIGRSNIVGKPLSMLLLHENATVTMAHSKTENLRWECQQADILIVATGHDKLIKKDWVKPGAIVIDVGINYYTDAKIRGDVDFEDVKKLASAITPVPGGVGPMTVAFLMQNTVKACCYSRDIVFDEL